jgi:3-dehydroquinate synthase
MRGVRFVLVPTTLLALIDASVGGKTGIDFLGGKNLLGTFAHPVGGLIDPEFLTTLSPVDRLAGLAEMLKHGLIADANHWHTLKKVVYKLLENPGSERFTALYNHSITLKRRIVAQDPTEQGLRKLLNFGHTVGHAAESALLSSDAPWSHGIAVGFGLYVETALSVRHAGLAASEAADICQFLQHLGYPAALPTGAVEAFFDFLQRDKKNIRNETRFVLLQSAGRAVYDIPIPVEAIREALGTVD